MINSQDYIKHPSHAPHTPVSPSTFNAVPEPAGPGHYVSDWGGAGGAVCGALVPGLVAHAEARLLEGPGREGCTC